MPLGSRGGEWPSQQLPRARGSTESKKQGRKQDGMPIMRLKTPIVSNQKLEDHNWCLVSNGLGRLLQSVPALLHVVAQFVELRALQSSAMSFMCIALTLTNAHVLEDMCVYK